MFSTSFNFGATRDALSRARAHLEDMTPIYRDIGEYMIEATRKRFQQGVSPAGVAWAPKRPATIERYKQLGYGALPKPLIGPGKRLSREIQQFVSRGGVVVGSSLIYAGVMQDGARKGAFGRTARGGFVPWGDIPARTWLGLSDADETAIVEIVEQHLAGDLDAAR